MTFLEQSPRVDDPPKLSFDGMFAPVADGGGDLPVLRLLIDGEWRTAAETFEVRTPIDGSVIAHAQEASDDDLQAAIASAKAARPSIRGSSRPSRLAMRSWPRPPPKTPRLCCSLPGRWRRPVYQTAS